VIQNYAISSRVCQNENCYIKKTIEWGGEPQYDDTNWEKTDFGCVSGSNPADTGDSCADVAEWDSSATYWYGDKVKSDGCCYEAKWWNIDAKPDHTYWNEWETVQCEEITCDNARAYVDNLPFDPRYGHKVTYEGCCYSARYWTQGETPGSDPYNGWTLESCNP